MLELLASLGRDKAVWIGHDWGSPVVWNMAAHHPDKTVGVASLCVPYLAAGFTLENGCRWSTARSIPRPSIRSGQWDYQFFYEENFDKARAGLRGQHPQRREGAVPQGQSRRRVGKPVAHRGGTQGTAAGSAAAPAPDLPRDADVLTEQDLEAYIAALTRNGFFGPELLVHEPQGQRRLCQARAERRQARRCRCCSCTAPTTRPARP